MPFQQPTTLPPPTPKASLRDTWTQSLITNFLSFNPPQSVSVSMSQISTTSKIYWPPQARFLIACHPNFKYGSRESYSPNHDEVQNTMWLATLQHMKGWLVRCSTHALGFGQIHLHVCQNLIFMSSLIWEADFHLANVFFLKIIWLSLSICYCGLTLLLHLGACLILWKKIEVWYNKNLPMKFL